MKHAVIKLHRLYGFEDKEDLIKIAAIVPKTSVYPSNKTLVRTSHRVLCEIIDEDENDIVIAPEYTYFHSRGPLDADERNRYLDSILRKSKGKRTLIIPGSFIWKTRAGRFYNTTYVIQNGEKILTHHKTDECGEEKIGELYDLAPSFGHYEGLFDWRHSSSSKTLRCRVDICQDNDALSGNGENNLDMQFIIACKLEYRSYGLRDGGKFVYVDGGYVESESGSKWRLCRE